MEDVREIFALQPVDFWKHDHSGKFNFEISSPAHNVILVKLKGEIDNEGIELFLQRTIWGYKILDEQKSKPNLYVIVNADELEFIDIESRQRIFASLKTLKYVQKIWCFSQNRWTQSYWRVIKLLIPYLGLELVTSYEEALSLAVDAQGENWKLKKRNIDSSFDWHWQEELKTRFFDRYLFKYVQFYDWKVELKDPGFSANFYWVETDIVYIELEGCLTEEHAKEFYHKKLEVLHFLKWNELKSVHLVINYSGITKTSYGAISILRLYLQEQPIPVARYIIGCSFLDKVKLSIVRSFLEPKIAIEYFTNSITDAFRMVKGFKNKNLISQKQSVKPDKFVQFLLKKQNSLFRNDERFRRKLFSHFSHLIGENKTPPPKLNFNNTYLGNEIFYALELLAADFKLAHTKIEDENLQLHQLRSNTLQQQLNPHFIFNVLNSVLGNLYEKKYPIAEHLLTNFSLLMRSVLENSQNENVRLDSEIDFLEKYLEMEQTRSNQGFNINFEIDPKLRSKIFKVLIPPMLIQPFLEQAIWHRLMPSKNERSLTVRFEEYVDCVRCSIQDNGIGLKKSAEMRDGKYDTSGTRTVRDRISALNTIGTHSVRTVEKDLGNGVIKGSSVQILIPFTMAELP